jgi:hypothetical protein
MLEKIEVEDSSESDEGRRARLVKERNTTAPPPEPAAPLPFDPARACGSASNSSWHFRHAHVFQYPPHLGGSSSFGSDCARCGHPEKHAIHGYTGD